MSVLTRMRGKGTGAGKRGATGSWLWKSGEPTSYFFHRGERGGEDDQKKKKKQRILSTSRDMVGGEAKARPFPILTNVAWREKEFGTTEGKGGETAGKSSPPLWDAVSGNEEETSGGKKGEVFPS